MYSIDFIPIYFEFYKKYIRHKVFLTFCCPNFNQISLRKMAMLKIIIVHLKLSIQKEN